MIGLVATLALALSPPVSAVGLYDTTGAPLGPGNPVYTAPATGAVTPDTAAGDFAATRNNTTGIYKSGQPIGDDAAGDLAAIRASTAAVQTSTGNTATYIGAPGAAAATADTGAFSLNSLTQRLLQSLTTGNGSAATTATQSTATAAATGAQADAAYSGTGNTTVVAALKGLYASLLKAGGQVTTVPLGVTTTTASASTSATANTFVTAINASASRRDCSIYAGVAYLIAVGSSPTTAQAIAIPAGQVFKCSSAGGTVITDQVNIASATASVPFVVWTN